MTSSAQGLLVVTSHKSTHHHHHHHHHHRPRRYSYGHHWEFRTHYGCPCGRNFSGRVRFISWRSSAPKNVKTVAMVVACSNHAPEFLAAPPVHNGNPFSGHVGSWERARLVNHMERKKPCTDVSSSFQALG